MKTVKRLMKNAANKQQIGKVKLNCNEMSPQIYQNGYHRTKIKIHVDEGMEN